jgi:hypothetical protein
MNMRSRIFTAILVVFACRLAAAEVFNLGSRLLGQNSGYWRQSNMVEILLADFQLVAGTSLHQGEKTALCRRAFYLKRNCFSSWQLSAGDHFILDSSGSLFSKGRSRAAPPSISSVFKTTRATASRWRIAYRGLHLARIKGPIQGGLLLAKNNRDISSSGSSFLLDMPHSQKYLSRLGRWQDRTLAAWSRVELPGNVDLLLCGAARTGNILESVRMGKLELLYRQPGYRLAFHYTRSEHEILWLQLRRRMKGFGTMRLDAWNGFKSPSAPYSRPVLPMITGSHAGGFSVGLKVCPDKKLSCELSRSNLFKREAGQVIIPWYRQDFTILWKPQKEGRSKMSFVWTSGHQHDRISLGADVILERNLVFSWRYSEAGKDKPVTSGHSLSLRSQQYNHVLAAHLGFKASFSLRKEGKGVLYQYQSAWPGYLIAESGSADGYSSGISLWLNKDLGNVISIFLAGFYYSKWRPVVADGYPESIRMDPGQQFGLELRIVGVKKSRR